MVWCASKYPRTVQRIVNNRQCSARGEPRKAIFPRWRRAARSRFAVVCEQPNWAMTSAVRSGWWDWSWARIHRWRSFSSVGRGSQMGPTGGEPGSLSGPFIRSWAVAGLASLALRTIGFLARRVAVTR